MHFHFVVFSCYETGSSDLSHAIGRVCPERSDFQTLARTRGSEMPSLGLPCCVLKYAMFSRALYIRNILLSNGFDVMSNCEFNGLVEKEKNL